ncbi:maleylpyruvate isomerase family mycothiol-dependent enzyme [Streptomyces hyaluromycini]|uniref:Maleylpyruvate isomerase family mycothiol-dependent enzyme n=1 Tax=Streptomyces hyaluromycini TaxID=1377993 RepID=A0ABV1WNX7_9ACTN
MSGRPEGMLEWVAKGAAAFEAAAHAVTDSDLTRPSSLTGWSRAHVIAHVARNADALANLLTWARTGVVTPMYTSPDRRALEIEEGSRQSADELRADLLAAGQRLADGFAGLPDECWDATVRTARGREVLASEVPWMRVREVWVHTVDLDAGTGFGDVPREVCAGLVDDVAAAFHARTDFLPVELWAEDGGRTWLLGPAGDAARVVVTGDLSSLAAYATGRPVPGLLYPTGGGPVSGLPEWL